MPSAKKTTNVSTHSSRGRVTQSFKLYQQLAKKGAASSVELAKAIGRPVHQTSVYVAELTRVYGAKIIYDTASRKYILQNKVEVPPQGVAGLRWQSQAYQPVPHINLAEQRTRGRPRQDVSVGMSAAAMRLGPRTQAKPQVRRGPGRPASR
jgi:hypothetical protein